MTTTFLFWNLGARPLAERVAHIAQARSVDVLILAECAGIAGFEASPGGPGGGFHHHAVPQTKIEVFSRFAPQQVVSLFDSGGVSIRQLKIGPFPGIILVAAHLPSRVHWSRDAQTLEATVISEDIRRVEERVGHARTMLVGDLNMDPYDPGVTGAQGLHGVMTRAVAGRRERTIRGRSYPFFYNPMWGCFGDRTSGPPGTHYYGSSSPDAAFWHLYDQVLVRPELAGTLSHLEVLDSDGETSLLTASGLPDRNRGSDHLPILFQLEL